MATAGIQYEFTRSRVCIIGSIDYLHPELTDKRLGFLPRSVGSEFADLQNGLGAISKAVALGWVQVVAYSGFIEFSGEFEDYESGPPGDYDWKLAAVIATGRLWWIWTSVVSSRTAILEQLAVVVHSSTLDDHCWYSKVDLGFSHQLASTILLASLLMAMRVRSNVATPPRLSVGRLRDCYQWGARRLRRN